MMHLLLLIFCTVSQLFWSLGCDSVQTKKEKKKERNNSDSLGESIVMI